MKFYHFKINVLSLEIFYSTQPLACIPFLFPFSGPVDLVDKVTGHLKLY